MRLDKREERQAEARGRYSRVREREGKAGRGSQIALNFNSLGIVTFTRPGYTCYHIRANIM